MKLFEFIKRISKEKFPIRLEYKESLDCVDVEVDTFSEKWVVSFDENGFVDFTIYTDIDFPINENVESLETLFNRPETAWKDAASDLGIEFISPFKFTGSDGVKYELTGLLPQFGGKNGTPITSRKDKNQAVFEIEKVEGYYLSGLNPRYYDKYDRERFIDTLQEWGWTSKDPAPEWV
ncbi:MAG: hypothetical protein GY705_17760 [Bacteroidetes bacterium]|nr:hypothetical protein [Bacteroidota bacterium]